MAQTKYVITISRQFASRGRSIAQELARQLGVEFYDRDIVEAAASRMGLPVSTISDNEESAGNLYYKRIYPLGTCLKSMQDEIDKLTEEVDRISSDTEYNTKTLLDGSSDVRVYSKQTERMDISDHVLPGTY